MSGQNVMSLPRKKTRTPPRIETITLTPAMAAEMLEHNRTNRPLREQHVHRIADEIGMGRWKFNGDTIKLSEAGDILDGQHRLWAVVEANKPVETVIVRDIAREAFATIDTIRAVRTGADVLALNGAVRYRHVIAPALQWLLRWQMRGVPLYRESKYRIENSDIEAAFLAHPGMTTAVEKAMRLRGITNPSIIGFLYYAIAASNPDLAERMLSTLANPVNVAVDDPFYVLRSYFLSDHRKRKDPVQSIAVAIKAANAAHAGKPVRHLSWRSARHNAEAFPLLDCSNSQTGAAS